MKKQLLFCSVLAVLLMPRCFSPLLRSSWRVGPGWGSWASFHHLKTHLHGCPGALLGVMACPDSLSVLTCSHQGVFNMTYIKPLYLDCSTVLHNGFFVIVPAN